jgi:hypothetical protein
LKAAETALQALEQQIRNRRKKNDWQMEKLANNLSVRFIEFKDHTKDDILFTSFTFQCRK